MSDFLCIEKHNVFKTVVFKAKFSNFKAFQSLLFESHVYFLPYPRFWFKCLYVSVLLFHMCAKIPFNNNNNKTLFDLPYHKLQSFSRTSRTVEQIELQNNNVRTAVINIPDITRSACIENETRIVKCSRKCSLSANKDIKK